MKSLLQKSLYVLLVITAHTSLFSYEIDFQNFTDKTLIIATKKRAAAGREKFYQIVSPGASVKQVWDDANCIESIRWAELDQKLPGKGGLDYVDPKQAFQIPREKQDAFDEIYTPLYPWAQAKIVIVSNETFRKTQQAATDLVKGIDTFICSAASAAHPAGRAACFIKLAGIADAAGKIEEISLCKSRSFMIYDSGQLDKITKQPLLIAATGEGEIQAGSQ
jgi:hypothetical protein